jgi:hypothetical protein
MQCGPVRYHALQAENAPVRLEVRPLNLYSPEIPQGSGIQDVFRILAYDSSRNHSIAKDILAAYHEGRKILVLTERTEQLELIREALADQIQYSHLSWISRRVANLIKGGESCYNLRMLNH